MISGTKPGRSTSGLTAKPANIGAKTHRATAKMQVLRRRAKINL
jgi:hypothetical protein